MNGKLNWGNRLNTTSSKKQQDLAAARNVKKITRTVLFDFVLDF